MKIMGLRLTVKLGVVKMEKLRLPRLVSDGMVLQQKKKIHIWGFDQPGRRIMVSFMGEEYVGITDADGEWEVSLKESAPGGPYTMHISDEEGNEKVVGDILIGDVFLCAGQSNMELHMERVQDKYPEEIKNCENNEIRTFKIIENGDFHGPLKELLTGEWKSAQPDTILDFSAVAYFFAKQHNQATGVPVGLINTSLGGSRIESWMSAEMLEGYDDFLQTAKRYADDEFIKERLAQNERQSNEWHGKLDSMDAGLQGHWEQEKLDETGWKPVMLPFFFRDTELAGFIGSVWFRRNFYVPAEMAGQAAKLWLGTIVDSDTVYVNGIQVGHTDYQYPPRKYPIPEGLLKEGNNTISIRVKCENGEGRFTPDKKYAIWNDKNEIALDGLWLFNIGASCEQIKETDFVNWKPTGLYNGMVAPCHQYTIGGVLWYQGESNTHGRDTEIYFDLTKRLIAGYRKNWKDEQLPFFYVQLPNFLIDLYPSDEDETGSGWPELREVQRQTLSVPGTGMVVAIDLGEDNDLHPHNKKDVGARLAMLAADRMYGVRSECTGPEVADMTVTQSGRQGCQVILTCKSVKGGMYAYSADKGKTVSDFELVGNDGICHVCKVKIEENKLILVCPSLTDKPQEVRYCYKNTNSGALIYNRSGFPMSPFLMKI